MNAAAALCRQARDRGLVADWAGAPSLGALLVTGPDAGPFLQSQLTSDVLALAPGQAQPSARLNRAGSLVAALQAYRLPERGQPFPSWLLLADRGQVADLAADLRAHVVTEDVVVDEATTEFDGRLVLGPRAPAALATLDEADRTALITVELPLTGDPGWLLLSTAGDAAAGAATTRLGRGHGLVDWPADADGATAWRWLCAEAGALRPGVDFLPGRRALAQTGLEQSVTSLAKGCYLGQEVVARVRTYGSVPEALRALVFEPRDDREGPPAVDAPGVPVHDETGARIGTWASAAWSVAWQAPVALAFLDRAHRTPGATLTVRLADGTTAAAQVRLSPLHAAAGAGDLARRLHERAVHRFSRGDDDGAIALLEQSLRADPSLAEAAEALGVILGRGGRYHEAIDIFRRLEELAPNEPIVHTNLSLFYMKIGDRQEAERQREQATLKRFASLDDAREAAERAEAETAVRRQDAARKLAMFAEVLELDPEDPLALLGAGNALATLDRHAEAEPLLGRARAAQPDNSALYLAHGRALELLDRGDEAAATYRAGVAVAGRKGDLQPLREMEHRLLLLTAAAT
jgi:folate-binding protein YgfZ